MSIEIKEKRVLSSDGVHQLYGRIYIPSGEPKGLFQVVHGMCEYIGRYDSFMRELAENGYIAFAHDHLGHGYTARDNGELGFIAHKDGWRRLVDDVALFGGAVREEYGKDLPYTLMGHSMGSFVVRLAAEKFNMQDKLIIMGSGGPNSASGLGLLLIKLIKLFKGEKHISKTVNMLAFGSYNSHFQSENDSRSWLTKDREVRARYSDDPLCNYYFTTSAMGDLVELNRRCNKSGWFKRIDKDKPILIVSGNDDPVGNYGRGVTAVFKLLYALDANVRLRLYPNCRHEILNDTCRDEVIRDIFEFVGE